mmetsp:Transcript_12965/g.30809  ORF Transcript_12965/g.30809 Transcript_12965/m.30809 type:complete len:208 (-) Transcript_12965:323-946(-)
MQPFCSFLQHQVFFAFDQVAAKLLKSTPQLKGLEVVVILPATSGTCGDVVAGCGVIVGSKTDSQSRPCFSSCVCARRTILKSASGIWAFDSGARLSDMPSQPFFLLLQHHVFCSAVQAELQSQIWSSQSYKTSLALSGSTARLGQALPFFRQQNSRVEVSHLSVSGSPAQSICFEPQPAASAVQLWHVGHWSTTSQYACMQPSFFFA